MEAAGRPPAPAPTAARQYKRVAVSERERKSEACADMNRSRVGRSHRDSRARRADIQTRNARDTSETLKHHRRKLTHTREHVSRC